MINATEIFCLNELGGRSNNEDSVSPQKGRAVLSDKVFIVCDGVGGEKKGEVASAIVARSLHEYLGKHTPAPGRERDGIQSAIQHANTQLSAYIQTDPAAKRMSTTMALVLLGQESVVAAWCGDTRIHHIRSGKILWKSKDHSLVGELVSQGELTEDEARHHPKRNIITRSLNALNFNNIVDYHEIRNLETGDYLLLCTDGLLERINDHLISEILDDENKGDKALAFLAHCDGATRDNFSMYLIRAERAIEKSRRRSAFWRLFFVVLAAVFAVLILVLLQNG